VILDVAEPFILFTAEMNFPNSRLVLTMAQLICTALNEVCIGWKTLHGQIDELLGTGDEIFDIEAHDHLIFDDELYSRPRTHFW
jgi:hypothetical protein